MTFGGVNYWGVLVAAVAAWMFGAAWYGALSKPWLAAVEKTESDIKRRQGTAMFYAPFVLSFIAELVMAWVVAGVIGHLGPGQVTVRNGLISAFLLWLGLVLTTTATNYAYPGRKLMLTVIDTGHWLGVLLIMGAIIGAWGVR